ncbi:MAG: CsgG/HfaB family protein [Elusimicrobia bacterium]|nr:CsgG/HfaB family protein [Elusimicrobiota bacterium]
MFKRNKLPLSSLGTFKAISFLFAMALCACSAMQITRNPNADLNSVRKVAVFPFAESPAQKRVTGEWETLLLSMGYRVVERSEMESMLKEQGLSVGGIVNPSDAPKIGEILGVDGIVFGRSNPRAPYHSYTLTGMPRISEPPPVSVKLVNAKTARVVWNLSDESMKKVQISRQGRAVDATLRKSLIKTLKEGNWSNIPPSKFYRETGGAIVAFNSEWDMKPGMRVGIYPFLSDNEQEDEGGAWADKFAGMLMGAGYDVVDRQQIEKMLFEQRGSLSGAIRPKEITELGKIAGLRGIVFGTIYGGEICAYHAKLVDVETGEVYWSAYGEDCSLDSLSNIFR